MRRAALIAVLIVASAAAETKDEELLALGKKIFVKECVGCHNEAGDKPIEGGPPLNERKIEVEYLLANIAGRLGPKSTADERKGVELYIRSFNRHFRAEAAKQEKSNK